MAFATTQTTNSALFRNLFFRNNDNSPISSLYILKTNGRGGTFWTPTVTPTDISSFYSSFQSTIAVVLNDKSALQSSFTLFSTQTFPLGISTVQGNYLSTFDYCYALNSSIALSFIGFSNQQIQQSNALTSALAIQTNQVYISSLQIAQSTYDSLRDLNTYTNAISTVGGVGSEAMSSISTAITVSNQNLYLTLSSLVTNAFNSTLYSSYLYTDRYYSTYSSILITTSKYAQYSTQYSQYQNSLFSSLNIFYSTSIANQSNEYSTISTSYQSTLTNEVSSVRGLNSAVITLYNFSTSIQSSIYEQTSSLTTGVFAAEDAKLSAYFSTITNEISTISSIAADNSNIVSSLSSYVATSISSISSINSTFYTQILGLASTYSTINVSTILGSVYDIFSLFEIFCNDLVISTITSVNYIQSTVYYSTILENNSTTNNYFSSLFQAPFVQSTIDATSTLVNQSISSYISSLYFSNPFIQSSIQSTINGKTREYNSTSLGIYTSQLSTAASVNQSSILNSLSTPTNQLLSTVSSLILITLSTFSGLGISSINGQNALYSTQSELFQQLPSTLLGNQISTNSSFQSTFLLYSTLYTGLFSTVRTSSILQNSLIQTQFLSSLLSYGSIFGTLLPSTTVNNYANQTFVANSQLTTLQTSTVTTYTNLVSSLTATLSTAAFSTLYTEQNITLGNTAFSGALDFRNFTNFYIRVRDPLLSGTTSSYALTYDYTSVSSLSNKTGIITIDVSTPTSVYTNNGSKLLIPTYKSGLPTTIWTEILPSISSANYIAMYEYTIQNSIVYTNLMNIYPKLTHSALAIQTSTNTGVVNSYWRGSQITLSWSNYSYLPINAIGLPAYNVEIGIDVLVNNTVISNAGPFAFGINTTTLNLPYLTGSYVNPVPTKIRSYIVGATDAPQELSLFTILPQFSNVSITPQAGNFLAIAELSAFTDSGTNAITSTNTTLLDGTGTTNAQFQIQAMNFSGSNSYLTIPNSVDFRFGTGDFTIECFLYIRPKGNASPYIFTFGSQASATFSLRFDTSGTSYINRPALNLGGTTYIDSFINDYSYLDNSWHHIAVCRGSGTLRVFLDGIARITVVTSYNFVDSVNSLTIGTDPILTSGYFLNGYITSFRWITGTALYTNDFYPPTNILQPITNTKLLLQASSAATVTADTSGTGKIVTNTNVTYPTFPKSNAVDGNPSTYTIGPSTLGVSASATQFLANTQLQTSLTSISTIRIINIDPTQYITFGSSSDADQLLNASLQVNTWAGSSNYISTIQLTNSSVQTFRF